MTFEWDLNKDALNREKHGIRFSDATSVFLDDDAVIFEDLKHSRQEHRELIIGNSSVGIIVVSFTERDSGTRIISARRANAKEKSRYQQYKKEKE